MAETALLIETEKRMLPWLFGEAWQREFHRNFILMAFFALDILVPAFENKVDLRMGKVLAVMPSPGKVADKLKIFALVLRVARHAMVHWVFYQY